MQKFCDCFVSLNIDLDSKMALSLMFGFIYLRSLILELRRRLFFTLGELSDSVSFILILFSILFLIKLEIFPLTSIDCTVLIVMTVLANMLAQF